MNDPDPEDIVDAIARRGIYTIPQFERAMEMYGGIRVDLSDVRWPKPIKEILQAGMGWSLSFNPSMKQYIPDAPVFWSPALSVATEEDPRYIYAIQHDRIECVYKFPTQDRCRDVIFAIAESNKDCHD
jgi:hypothetical protein